MITTHHRAVYDSARQLSLDIYLSALLAPREVRDDLVALAAFKGEIESIPLKVQEPLVGEIRLQWWRDWLDNGEGYSSGNPTADALGETITRRGLDRDLILKMLGSQGVYFYDEPISSSGDFLSHVGRFDGAGFALAANVMGASDSPQLVEFVEAAGRAFGTARILTRLRAFASRGIWPLPLPPGSLELSSASELIANQGRVAERRASVEYVIAIAREEMSRVASLQACVRNSSCDWRCVLPLALVEPYFQAFERCDGDPLMNRVDVSPIERRWRLWIASWRNGV